jgi:hypothetical protein
MNYLKITFVRKLKFKLKQFQLKPKLKQAYKTLEEWGKAAAYAIHR